MEKIADAILCVWWLSLVVVCGDVAIEAELEMIKQPQGSLMNDKAGSGSSWQLAVGTGYEG
jgi:hypothetical protein